MSDMLARGDVSRCSGSPAGERPVKAHPAKAAELGGGLKIRRALPVRGKRMIGAWCFLDHFGPLEFGDRKAMDVAPHPHIGLQTVTWLLEGEVLHKDSLGYEQLIQPGQLNIMTAGSGIVHSEETPPRSSGKVHGVQLWIAQPEGDRHGPPAFDHHPELPVVEQNGLVARLLVGEALGQRSPARVFSPLVGLDAAVATAGDYALPLNPAYEHALIVVEGAIEGDRVPMTPGSLYDLGVGRDGFAFRAADAARLVLIGGAPFGEEIAMWWNFVARNGEELRAAREDWEAGRRFGPVAAYRGGRLSAPPLNYRIRQR